MIDQKKIEQAAQKYADNNKQLPRDFYGAEIVCKVDFQAGVRFAESEMGQAQTFEIDFAGQVKAKIEFKDGELIIIAAMNGYGDALDPDQITITKQSHENES